MYFLPKLHEEKSPLRPKVSFVGSPIYNLSIYLANSLTHAFDRDIYHVRDSYEVANVSQEPKIPEG